MVSADSSVETRPEYFLSESLEIAQNIGVIRRVDIRKHPLVRSIETGASGKFSEAFGLYYASVDVYFRVKLNRACSCFSLPDVAGGYNCA